MTHAHTEYPDHPMRSEEEQQSHDRVVELLSQHLQEKGIEDVRTNPGESREHAIQIEGEAEIYPDVFTVEGDQVTAICEVETPSTVHEGSVEQWKDYANLGPAFLLVVPMEEAEAAQQLVEENQIPCQSILTYQLAAPGGGDSPSPPPSSSPSP